MESERITISNASCGSKKSFDSVSILVVDDDTTCLSIIAAILKKFKYEVVTVKHAEDALCALRIKGGAFDLVVSDVHMPDMNGFELQRVIAREFNLPVVLMSADNEEGVVLKGLENGAAFFILKPVSADDLRDLWQFASMGNKKNQVTIDERLLDDDINQVSESSVLDEDGNTKKDWKRKSPRKGGYFDEKIEDNNSESSSQKRPKVVWSNALHNRFLEAIRSIGLDRAVPKKILEVMNVPGLTRENVASHLQKYRIFLRRVSGAGYRIPYSPDIGLNRILTATTTNSSIFTSNNFTGNKYQNPGKYLGVNNGLFFQNQEAPGFDLSRILSSNTGRFLKPNHANSGLLIRDTDVSHARFARKNIRPGLEDLSENLSTCFDTSVLSSVGFHTATVSNARPSSFAYQTNYVGLKMSNLKQLTESGGGMVTPPGSEFQGNLSGAVDNDTGLDQLLQSVGDSTCFGPDPNGGKRLSDVIADYQMLINPSISGFVSGTENGGPIQESDSSPDLVAFDIMSSEHQSLGESGYKISLADEVIFHGQGQQINGNGATNSLDFNTRSQFGAAPLSPSEREDQEFLASLLASDQFGEEQRTLDGM